MKELIIKNIRALKLGKPRLPKLHPDYKRACEDNEVHNDALNQAIKIINKS